jgi:hypothetical protein
MKTYDADNDPLTESGEHISFARERAIAARCDVLVFNGRMYHTLSLDECTQSEPLKEATPATLPAPAVSGYVCDACADPATRECGCPRCQREPDRSERYRCCAEHSDEVSATHERVRGSRVPCWINVKKNEWV